MSESRRPSRRRAALFAALAVVCGLISAAAARRDAGAAAGLGELRSVVVVEKRLPRGSRLTRERVEGALTVSDLPARFLPPDTLADPALALAARTVGEIPAGSYLLASHLRQAGTAKPARPALGSGLRPVEVVVSGGAGGAAAMPRPGSRVDVLAADEPGTTSHPRVRVLARGVPLLGLEPLRDGAEPPSAAPGASWLATLALDRERSLVVIEADNYAREVRLLPR